MLKLENKSKPATMTVSSFIVNINVLITHEMQIRFIFNYTIIKHDFIFNLRYNIIHFFFTLYGQLGLVRLI